MSRIRKILLAFAYISIIKKALKIASNYTTTIKKALVVFTYGITKIIKNPVITEIWKFLVGFPETSISKLQRLSTQVSFSKQLSSCIIYAFIIKTLFTLLDHWLRFVINLFVSTNDKQLQCRNFSTTLAHNKLLHKCIKTISTFHFGTNLRQRWCTNQTYYTLKRELRELLEKEKEPLFWAEEVVDYLQGILCREYYPEETVGCFTQEGKIILLNDNELQDAIEIQKQAKQERIRSPIDSEYSISFIPPTFHNEEERLRYVINLSEEGRIGECSAVIKELASEGIVSAQVLYGICLRNGMGCEINPQLSFAYIKEAVNIAAIAYESADTPSTRNDLAFATFELGNSYCGGWGCEENKFFGKLCYESAVLCGDTEAMIKLAECYLLGIGGPKSHKLAAAYYKMAAVNGRYEAGTEWIWNSEYAIRAGNNLSKSKVVADIILSSSNPMERIRRCYINYKNSQSALQMENGENEGSQVVRRSNYSTGWRRWY